MRIYNIRRTNILLNIPLNPNPNITDLSLHRNQKMQPWLQMFYKTKGAITSTARTEVVSAVLDGKDYVIDDESDKTTDEVEVYDPQTDSLGMVLFCPKEQIILPLLLIIVNRL